MFLLTSIDILGPELNIKYKSKDSFKTPIGGILTILFVCLITLAFVAFSRDIFEKKQPIVTFNKQIATNSVSYLAWNNFAFTFLDQATNDPIIDFNQRFVIYLSVFYNQHNGTYSQVNYNFDKCDSSFLTEIKTQLKAPQQNYYCLPINTTIRINGVFLVGNFTSIRLNVDYCDNAKYNRTDCKLKSDTLKVISNIKYNLILTDYFTNAFNFSFPFVKNYYIEDVIVTTSSFTRKMINLKEIEYDTDLGWVIESYDTQIKNAVDKSDTTVIPTSNSNTIYSIMFGNSNWNDVYTRKYIKLQDILANIGGFMRIWQVIFQAMCVYLIYPEILESFFLKYNERKTPTNIKNTSVNHLKTISQINIENHINDLTIGNQSIVNQSSASHQPRTEIKKNNFFELIIEKSKTMNRSNTSKHKIEFKLETFSLVHKFFRSCLTLKKSNVKITQQIQLLNKLYTKKFSLENFLNISRKVRLFEAILFEDYQRNLLRYIAIPKHKKINSSYEEISAEMESNIKEPINKNLKIYLTK